MRAIDIDEMELRMLFRMIFDSRQFIQQGAICIGFVSGRIVHVTFNEVMEFTLPHPDKIGLWSLYERINKAIKKGFPDAKVVNVASEITMSAGIVVKF